MLILEPIPMARGIRSSNWPNFSHTSLFCCKRMEENRDGQLRIRNQGTESSPKGKKGRALLLEDWGWEHLLSKKISSYFHPHSRCCCRGKNVSGSGNRLFLAEPQRASDVSDETVCPGRMRRAVGEGQPFRRRPRQVNPDVWIMSNLKGGAETVGEL